MSLPLLALDIIRQRLDERFAPLEPMLVGYRLLSVCSDVSEFENCARQIGCTFPQSFIEIVTNYDFGQLTIGPIVFGTTGNYSQWLLRMNTQSTANPFPWWGPENRPPNLCLIAISDPHAVFLDLNKGAIFASLHGVPFQEGSIQVASNFQLFLRGLGTAILERHSEGGNQSLADEIAESVGVSAGNPFWREIAE